MLRETQVDNYSPFDPRDANWDPTVPLYAENPGLFEAQRWPSGAAIVPLASWSDATWLQWAHMTASNIEQQRNIEYIMQNSVINRDTQAVVWEVIGGVGQLGDFETRHEFVPEMPEFDAMLGTPNANGVAWFLIQHRAQLGQRSIDKIVIYDEEDWFDSGPREFPLQLTLIFGISPYTGPAPAVPAPAISSVSS